MTPEEKAQADEIDLRCLSLCIGMLERVNGVRVFVCFFDSDGGITEVAAGQTFEENSTLEGILADLIIPAVKRKELALREKGLVSLGLCCLIAKVGILSTCI
jgi:condensin complex subunit 3